MHKITIFLSYCLSRCGKIYHSFFNGSDKGSLPFAGQCMDRVYTEEQTTHYIMT